MPDHPDNIAYRDDILFPEIDAPLSRLDITVLASECREMSRAARIERYVVLLIRDCNPTSAQRIGGHPVFHTDINIREAFQYQPVKCIDMSSTRLWYGIDILEDALVHG